MNRKSLKALAKDSAKNRNRPQRIQRIIERPTIKNIILKSNAKLNRKGF